MVTIFSIFDGKTVETSNFEVFLGQMPSELGVIEVLAVAKHDTLFCVSLRFASFGNHLLTLMNGQGKLKRYPTS